MPVVSPVSATKMFPAGKCAACGHLTTDHGVPYIPFNTNPEYWNHAFCNLCQVVCETSVKGGVLSVTT